MSWHRIFDIIHPSSAKYPGPGLSYHFNPAPSGGFKVYPMPDGICNSSSTVWFCPGICSHLDVPAKPLQGGIHQSSCSNVLQPRLAPIYMRNRWFYSDLLPEVYPNLPKVFSVTCICILFLLITTKSSWPQVRVGT